MLKKGQQIVRVNVINFYLVVCLLVLIVLINKQLVIYMLILHHWHVGVQLLLLPIIAGINQLLMIVVKLEHVQLLLLY